MEREIFQARAVYLVFMLLGWWRSHVSVLRATQHHIKESWLCYSDVLLCSASCYIFGPIAGLTLVYQRSLSILFS